MYYKDFTLSSRLHISIFSVLHSPISPCYLIMPSILILQFIIIFSQRRQQLMTEFISVDWEIVILNHIRTPTFLWLGRKLKLSLFNTYVDELHAFSNVLMSHECNHYQDGKHSIADNALFKATRWNILCWLCVTRLCVIGAAKLPSAEINAVNTKHGFWIHIVTDDN